MQHFAMSRSPILSFDTAIKAAKYLGLRHFEVKCLPHGTEIWVAGVQVIGTRPYNLVKVQEPKKGWHPQGKPPRDGWYTTRQTFPISLSPSITKPKPTQWFLAFLDDEENQVGTTHYSETRMAPLKNAQSLAASKGLPLQNLTADWRELILQDTTITRPGSGTAIVGTFDAAGNFNATGRKIL
jgi:hypothetical protein